jgi:tRNA pseudouridine55 synthase
MLVVDKQPGPTSNKVLQSVRGILGRPKAGHAGTLDPQAAGVLLVCLGEATKIIPYLAELEKEYLGTLRFGEETDTCDRWGKVTVSAPTDHLSRELIERKMQEFTGGLLQKPPMFSALKVRGQRLYELARRGEKVERAPRKVLVSEFSLLGWGEDGLEFRVRCGSGTYVRALCRDLGRACKSAAHMTALTRSAVGPFRREDGLTPEGLEKVPRDGLPLVGLAEALEHLPLIRATDGSAAEVRQGRRILPPRPLPEGLREGKPVRLVDRNGFLVAILTYRGPGEEMLIERGFS